MIGMRRVVVGILVLGVVMSVVSTGWAVPPMINVQGRLTDSAGVPVTRLIPVTFRIYDAPTAGTLLWRQEMSVRPDDRGIFNVIIGKISEEFLGDEYYLGIKVSDMEPEMTPRQRLVAVPFAVTSKNLKGGIVEDAESVKLAALAPGDMTAAPGKICFNGDTRRLQYHDGSQWISLDPPYTSKPIKMVNKYTANRTTYVMPADIRGRTVPIFTPTTDCILVACSGSVHQNLYPTSYYYYYIRFRLKQGSDQKVDFAVHDEAQSGFMNRAFYYSFPFPIKVNAGTSVDLECLEASWGDNARLKDFGLYYIELPLDVE